jgi:hypothetical protein
MPASSEEMRRFMCLAWSVKKGERPKSEVSARVVETAEKMTHEQLQDFCESPVQK